MSKLRDISGLRYFRLIVVGFCGSKKGKSYWKCVCDCGREIEVEKSGLLQKKVISCGCWARERLLERITKHGDSKVGFRAPEYICWKAMKSRCFLKTAKSYKYYGARGITVCERWRSSYKNFLNDMGRKPSKNLSIERINNDGNYEPGNCKWATIKEQRANQRPRKTIKFSVP